MQSPQRRVEAWGRKETCALVRELSAVAASTGNEDRLTAAVEAYVKSAAGPWSGTR